jgi:putative transposase
MMAERGVIVSYESVREWCLKFGGTYTKQIRSRRGRLGDRWHLDEVFLRINGKLHYLWRAVDQDGEVLDILVQSRSHKQAAQKFFRKLLKGLQYIPRTVITDKLRSYEAAKAEFMPSVEHHRDKGLNNRAENSHQPIREREAPAAKSRAPGTPVLSALALRWQARHCSAGTPLPAGPRTTLTKGRCRSSPC